MTCRTECVSACRTYVRRIPTAACEVSMASRAPRRARDALRERLTLARFRLTFVQGVASRCSVHQRNSRCVRPPANLVDSPRASVARFVVYTLAHFGATAWLSRSFVYAHAAALAPAFCGRRRCACASGRDARPSRPRPTRGAHASPPPAPAGLGFPSHDSPDPGCGSSALALTPGR